MSYFQVDQIEPKKPGDGVEVRVIAGEKMTMAFFHMEQDAVVPEHTHPHEQMGTVLKGTLELNIGGEKTVFTPGLAWHIPSEMPHSGRCLDGPAEILEFFAPPREDLVQAD
jgi:quercetin dioxygenase-like cupin family protein